ncbi:MAG: hypothetical protein ABI367_05105 [Mucilaginibacter sp.]
MDNLSKTQLLHRIKVRIWIIIAGLALSGITAFPIETELAIFTDHGPTLPGILSLWLNQIYDAVRLTNLRYPFISYGTDWLAFAHLMLAILFIGPLKDPVKNIWVIQFGIIAAVLIFPLAFIAGNISGIPLFWQLIDCSFGVVTLLILIPCYRMIIKLNNTQ